MNQLRFFAALSLCLLLANGFARAAPIATVSVPGLTLTVSAVDPGVFHLSASPPNNPVPPVSPFVVETMPWPGAVVRRTPNGAATVQTLKALLAVQRSGRLSLQDSAGHALLPSGTITTANGTITLTLTHDAGERFYGADAAFTLYEDDGDTYAYQKGIASHIPMRWDDRTQTLTVGTRIGAFPGMLSTRHLNVVLPDGYRQSVTYTGKTIQIKRTP